MGLRGQIHDFPLFKCFTQVTGFNHMRYTKCAETHINVGNSPDFLAVGEKTSLVFTGLGGISGFFIEDLMRD